MRPTSCTVSVRICDQDAGKQLHSFSKDRFTHMKKKMDDSLYIQSICTIKGNKKKECMCIQHKKRTLNVNRKGT